MTSSDDRRGDSRSRRAGSSALRILFVEDSEADARLALRELERAGLPCVSRRVDTRDAFIRELHEHDPDIVLCDFTLPGFSGLEALALARELRPDVPCLLLSGSIGEESAIESLKCGAADYILKNNLVRLAPAVQRAMREREANRARRRAEQALAASEERLRLMWETTSDVVVLIDSTGRIEYANPAAREVFGYEPDELIGRDVSLIQPERLREAHRRAFARFLETGVRTLNWRGVEFPALHRDGHEFTTEIAFSHMVIGGKPAFAAFIRDITERKRVEQQLRDSEARYRGLIEHASDGIFLADADGRFVMVNTRGCELLGYDRAEILSMNVRDTYLEEDRGQHAARIRRALAGETLRFERMVRRKDGSAFPAEIGAKMLESGVVQVIFHDISQRRAQELKVTRLSRIHAVLSGINSAIVRIRDRQELFDEACRIIVEHGGFSVGWIAMLDRERGMLIPVAQAGLPMDLGVVKQPGNRPAGFAPAGAAAIAVHEKRIAVDNDLEATADASDGDAHRDTLSVRRAAIRLGAESVVVLPLFAEEELFGVLTLYAPERDFFDDEELKLLNELSADISFALAFIAKDEKVNYLAYYDALTGLANRTLLFDRLGQYIREARREQGLCAVILADLERFHVINESLGRSAGDALLRELAKRLREHMRAEDTVSRAGADVFAVALTNIGSAEEVAHLLNDRVSVFVRQAIALAGQELRVSVRYGAAIFPTDGDSADTLYANAEAALKKAKATGERFLFYAPEMNARIAESLMLENRLRAALETEQFVLHYQPKITLAEGRIVGLEALIRWQAPDLGLVPPAKFVPLMEETGLILGAGRWALQQVARDCRRWTAQGLAPPRIAVNVSSIEMRQKNFVDIMASAADEIRRAGGMLDLEITESVIMADIEAVRNKLEILRGLGVEISVDDFGTGYSSLSYVARLPLHALKIDRSFVVDMTHGDGRAIVNSIISMAHALRLKVIAEGVETEEQAKELRRLGCDQMQGYLFSPPVPAEAVPGLLRCPS